jgi:hypothetical protein
MKTKKSIIAALVLVLFVVGVNSARANQTSSLGLEVGDDTFESIFGPAALALLETLPPNQSYGLGFNETELNQIKKHFRSLVLTTKAGGPAIILECSSAKWAYVGYGRAAQLKLVASNPQCHVHSDAESSFAQVTNKSLAEIAEEASLANKIVAPLEAEKECNTRLCD